MGGSLIHAEGVRLAFLILGNEVTPAAGIAH